MLKSRKDKGGLGFKDLPTFNKAMLGKQALRLAENQYSLWGRVLKGLYFPNKPFFRAEKGSRPSWGWQSILYGREAISGSVRWAIGNGESVNIREDLWLHRGTIGGPANKSDPKRVADLICQQNASWKESDLRQIFDAEIVEDILSIPLKSPLAKDRLIWTERQSGKYSVKSGYNACREKETQHSAYQASSSFQPTPRFWNSIWKAHIPPKWRFFLWNVCQNALPTKENLAKRNIIYQPECPICYSEVETTEHIFTRCPWTEQIWTNPRLFGLNQRPFAQRMDKWIYETVEGVGSNFTLETLAAVLWCIWKSRNNAVFRGAIPSAADLVSEADILLLSYSKWNRKEMSQKNSTLPLPPKWIPPKDPDLKLNVDASLDIKTATGAVSGVLRDSRGTVLGGFAEKVRSWSPIEAEAQALLAGLKFLQSWKAKQTKSLESRKEKELKMFLESDCRTLVAAVNAVEEASWEAEHLILEARDRMAQLNNVSLAHCARDANRAADWIAKNTRANNIHPSWISNPPLPLWSLLCFDAPAPGLYCKNS